MKRLWPLTALLVMVLVSALSVVYAKHRSRTLFVDLQALEGQRDKMNIDWGRLQLEESTWATHGRVENDARNKLGMLVPVPNDVVIVHP